MTTLSKETCAALKEMGVKGESDFEWSYWTDHGAAEQSNCHEQHWEVADKNGGNFGERYPAYILSDLPHVLREMAIIKGWKEKYMCPCTQSTRCESECEIDSKYMEPQWLYYFLEISRLFAEGGMSAAETYLLTLIK